MVGTAAMKWSFCVICSDLWRHVALISDGVSAIAKLARRIRVHGLTCCCSPE